MPTAMKQPMLSFGLPRPASSKPGPSEPIAVDDGSDEDDIATPPPPRLQALKPLSTDGTHAPYPYEPTALPAPKIVQSPDLVREAAKTSSGGEESSLPGLLPDTLPGLAPKKWTKEAKEARKLEKRRERASNHAAPGAESILCHQHRSACSPILRCTRLKENGVRCAGKYRYNSLQRVYKQDAKQILKAGRNILGVDVKEHVGPVEANYLWKCPRCRGNCQCSLCRKKAGMAPLGPMGQDPAHEGDARLPSTSKRRATGENEVEHKRKKRPALNSKEGRQTPLLVESFAKTNSSITAPQGSVPPKPRVVALQQQTFQKPLRKPKMEEAPTLQPMQTRLPVANLMERIWLYESLIRFDLFNVPKAVLTRLDRFDDWTEGLVQTILEKLVCRIANIKSIKVAPLRTSHKRAVEALRIHGGDLTRGEPWEAAKNLCQAKEVRICSLEAVEILPHQQTDLRSFRSAPLDPSETLLGSRMTRSRRAAETRAMERVKAISAREMEGSEESSSDEGSDEESAGESSEEFNEGMPSRGSRRAKVIGTRRSARQRGRIIASSSDSGEEDSRVESTEGTPDVNVISDSEEEEDVVAHGEPAPPLAAPHFEEKVAILSGLVELLMQTKEVAEEITVGSKHAIALEKEAREEFREMVKEHEEEMQSLNSRAPSMTLTEDFTQWKEEKHKLEREQRYALLDCRVHAHLQIEAHKARSGPLGTDVDGNEYWQLSEYVESQPEDTTGRWAWSLLVLGTTFNAAAREKADAVESNAVTGRESSPAQRRALPEVIVDLPSKKQAAIHGSTAEKTAADGAERGFTCASDWHTIARLIAYIRYRLALREHDELTQERSKEEASSVEAPSAVLLSARGEEREAAGSSGSRSTLVNEPVRAATNEKRRVRAELRAAQAERRLQIEMLIKRLDVVRQYYQWHSEEGPSP